MKNRFAKSQMLPRERILAAINHSPVDKLPLDYWGVPEVTDKLFKHFNVANEMQLAKAMDIDLIFGVGASMTKPNRNGDWDIQMKRSPLPDGSGFYDVPVSNPLKNCTSINEIDAVYEWPTTDMFDYSKVKQECKYIREQGYAVRIGYISLTYFYQLIRGNEEMMMDFAAEQEIAEYILYKINEFASSHTSRLLEAADGLVDISEVTDDFGSQIGLLYSKEMIEHYLGKYYVDNINMLKSYGVKVFHHNCGAIQSVIPWISEKGCEILNPIQWHLPGWDLKKLKSEHGSKLCFHGGIDNQHVLPFGTIDEVKKEVDICIDNLFSDKTGYILSSCHALQANTPLENILTMFSHAKAYSEI